MMRGTCEGCGAPLVLAVRCSYCGRVATAPRRSAALMLRALVRDLNDAELAKMLSTIAAKSPSVAQTIVDLIADVRRKDSAR